MATEIAIGAFVRLTVAVARLVRWLSVRVRRWLERCLSGVVCDDGRRCNG